MAIFKQHAVVYRGGGRRWFSAKAAANAAAKATMRARCECSEPEYADGDRMAYPGDTCRLHQPDRFPKILRRLARLHLKNIKEGL